MLPSTILAIHSWTLYAIAISLIFTRIISRRITLGYFKRLQADDWLMASVLLPITASTILANQISNGQSERQRKFRYLFEELQLVTIWLVKACLVVLYWRIFPVEMHAWKRHVLKFITAFCCISFLIVQVSLLVSCRPVEKYWDVASTNPQCTTYHTHTALTLALNIPTTILIMILPVPFIPTPRRVLLAVLLLLGTLVLISGIISRTTILTSSSKNPPALILPHYLTWSTSESTLSVIFANLPFLTSLVVATAPSRRIKNFSQNLRASSNMALSQWPRSRRDSCAAIQEDEEGMRHISSSSSARRASRLYSTATTTTTTTTTLTSPPRTPTETKNSPTEYDAYMPYTQPTIFIPRNPHHNRSRRYSPLLPPLPQPPPQAPPPLLFPSSSSPSKTHNLATDSNPSSPPPPPPQQQHTHHHTSPSPSPSPSPQPTLPSPPPTTDAVPKTRLSGGLAEMGGISMLNTQGWPIYWG